MPRDTKLALVPEVEDEELVDAQERPRPSPRLNLNSRATTIREVRDLARKFTVRNLNHLLHLSENADDQRVQLAATVELLRRAWGNPVAESEHEVDPTTAEGITARAEKFKELLENNEHLKKTLAALQAAGIIGGHLDPPTPQHAPEEMKTVPDAPALESTALVVSHQPRRCFCGHLPTEHEGGMTSCEVCGCPMYDPNCMKCAHPHSRHAPVCDADKCFCDNPT